MENACHRHKRSFGEMSPPTSGTSNHQFLPTRSTGRAEDDDDDSLFITSINRESQEVTEVPNPRGGNSATQTVIDLTDDQEDVTLVSRSLGSRNPSGIAGRNNAFNSAAYVDLTGDLGPELEEDEIIVTGQRRVILRPGTATRPGRRPVHGNNSANVGRSSSPSLFVSAGTSAPPSRHLLRDPSITLGLVGYGHMIPSLIESIPALVQLSAFQPMPNRMDYARNAFDRKPDHVAPPAARENFTRSPTKNDTIICPSCETELIHHKQESLPTKKGGKGPSKKDREEHPFWVVRDCGHVYCNLCYQNRLDKGRTTNFRDAPKPPGKASQAKKSILCAVEDCKCDVKSKERWVGIFM